MLTAHALCRSAKEPLMFEDGVAIGHSGQVITYGARATCFAGAFAGLLANFPRLLQVEPEKLFQHAHRAQIGLMYDRIEIKIFVEKSPQLCIQFVTLRTA